MRALSVFKDFLQTCFSCASISSLWIQLKQKRIDSLVLMHVCYAMDVYSYTRVIRHHWLSKVLMLDATFDPSMTHLIGTPPNLSSVSKVYQKSVSKSPHSDMTPL